MAAIAFRAEPGVLAESWMHLEILPPARPEDPDGLVPALDRGLREVLALVAEGLSNKLIARRLDIAERTVKAHLTRVFAVLGVPDRTSAALWAQRHNLHG